MKEGGQIPLGEYTQDLPWRPRPFTASAVPERVLAEFEAGATIVLQGLHLWWQPLAEYCRGLEQALGHPVQANAYYTPRASQGFAVHHDTHDVFVLQVAGEKRWLVSEPVLPLPLKTQRWSPELGEPRAPMLDLTLRPGDTLYLPRGWLHEALTSDADSLHVTVGVNVHTWLDALRAAVETLADDVELRRAVAPDGRPPVDLAERLRARLEPEEIAQRARERLVRTRRPILDGQLSQLRALDRLAADTPLERRPTVIADLALREEGAVLSFGGKEVVFPAHAAPELEFAVTAAGSFRALDLPGDLDEAGRLVLARRLVREGFLRVSAEPRADGRAPRNAAGAADSSRRT